MVTVKVFGRGCERCAKLLDGAQQAIAASGVEASLEKVEDLEAMMAHGVVVTPALVIDGEVRSCGRLPEVAKIAGWLQEAATRST